MVFSQDALHATLKVKQGCEGLFQTFSVILVSTALLKLLQKYPKKETKKQTH